MQIKKWKWHLYFIGFTEAVGALSGILTKEGTKTYVAFVNKPTLTPPGAVFPIVWSLLYALMGIGAGCIWKSTPSPKRSYSLLLFVVQLTVNFCWSLFFFNEKAYGFALIWLLLLWILIICMILAFYQVNKKAAYLQIPYLLWVTFAAYLNFMVWQLN